MTIDKAIKILSHNDLQPEGTNWAEYLEAVQLGAEALKILLKLRAWGSIIASRPLPGETTA